MNLSATYEVNLDRQLASSTDINIAPSEGLREFQIQGGSGAVGVKAGERFLVPLYTARVSTAFGPVTEITSHVNASYNGLVAAATIHGRNLSGRVSYSWSKAIDYGANASATPRDEWSVRPVPQWIRQGAVLAELSSGSAPERGPGVRERVGRGQSCTG